MVYNMFVIVGIATDYGASWLFTTATISIVCLHIWKVPNLSFEHNLIEYRFVASILNVFNVPAHSMYESIRFDRRIKDSVALLNYRCIGWAWISLSITLNRFILASYWTRWTFIMTDSHARYWILFPAINHLSQFRPLFSPQSSALHEVLINLINLNRKKN